MRPTILFVSCLLLNSALAATATPNLNYLQAVQANQQLQSHTLTSEQLVQHYLQRIAKLDQQGPALHAITDLNPDALAQAKQLDNERAQGKLRGPLHGLPVLLKANIATGDTLPTTAGALVLKDFRTARDAELVKNLRQAGAIILGKTNLSEWANFRGAGSASGWSALGGQTKNPYVLSQTPCGSSSGSGVAIAADLGLLAVGTETDGSITCPSAMNHIVGLKPTHGAISGDGIIPIASSQDTAGPMTRSVADAALLLSAMATPEANQTWGRLTDATQQQPVKRVMLVRQYDQASPSVAAMMDNLKKQLVALGIEVQERTDWSLPDNAYKAEFDVLIYEYQRDLSAWLRQFNAPVQSLQQIVDFNRKQGKAALAFYGQQYLEQASQIDLQKDHAAYQQARNLSKQAAEQLLLEDLAKVDVIIAPTAGPAWAIDHVKGDQFNFESASPAAISGYPSMTIPAGFDGPLPLGVSIIAKPWQEAKIIGLGAALEQRLAAWQAPQYKPTLAD